MRWLLLRGLVREQRHWLGFPAYFAAHVQSPDGAPTTVITLDLPGFGSENDAPVPRTIAGFVDDLRERLRRSIDAGERCGIFGVSLGGMVALNWLERFPDDLAAGVIVNSSLADLSPPWERIRAANWPRVLLAPLLPLRARERMLLGMTRYQGDLRRRCRPVRRDRRRDAAAPRQCRRPSARRARDAQPRAHRRPDAGADLVR